MIKCKIQQGKQIEMKFSGTAFEIGKDVALIITEALQCIWEQDPEQEKKVKYILAMMFLDPNSPLNNRKEAGNE